MLVIRFLVVTQDVEEAVMQVEVHHELEVARRRSLVVWMYSLRQVRNLRRYGSVLYISKRMKYALVYLNEGDFDASSEKIERLHFVRKIERSYRPDIEMNFADKIGTKRAFQPVDDGYEVEEKSTKIRLAENV